jgi:hypothetical protein
MKVVLPAMAAPQEQAWLSLPSMTEILPAGWCLVGGQMVHLHCAERGSSPNRPTDDVDAVLDVRAHPGILAGFTGALMSLGFASAGESMAGHEHRWVKGGAQIDILIPRGIGERAARRRGATGGTTLETPGAQQALDRTELVDVEIAGRSGRVPRPSLAGALVIKAAAYSVTGDIYRARHLQDLVVLSTLITRHDGLAAELGRRDRAYLRSALLAVQERRETWIGIEDGERGTAVLAALLS